MLRTLFPLARRLGAALQYLLKDEFSTDRIAGAVNGTQAEPTGGARSVADVLNSISISSGDLFFAVGGQTNVDNVRWTAQTKAKGLLLSFTNTSIAAPSQYIGWDDNLSGTAKDSIMFTGSNISAQANGTIITIGFGLGTTNVPYVGIIISKGAGTSGYYYFIKGGVYTEWTLLFSSPVGGFSIYPEVARGGNTSSFRVSKIAVVQQDWIPNPLAYDSFTRADGSAGQTESAGPEGQTLPAISWSVGSISANKLSITPQFGANLIVNGGFDSDTTWTKGTGWSIGSGVGSKVAGTQADITQVACTPNKFYEYVYAVPTLTAGSCYAIFGHGVWIGRQIWSTAAGIINSRWQLTGTSAGVRGTSAFAGTIDNFSAREIVTSSIFAAVQTSESYVYAAADIVSTNGTMAGLVLNLDSPTNPQNYVIVWHDGINLHVDKCVNGVHTILYNTAKAYVAGTRLIAYRDAGGYSFSYGWVYAGTVAVTDASIINNTYHGIISTYAANTFDNFELLSRGSNGIYSLLDQFIGAA